MGKEVPVARLTLCLSLALSAIHATAAEGVGPYYATPSWSQQLPPATRFIVLTNFASQAVVDRETGLVWEKAPSMATNNWFSASFQCGNLSLGGRSGWRLPTRAELLSLVDRSQASPSLPAGHPFIVQKFAMWSASTRAEVVSHAWVVHFSEGLVLSAVKSNEFEFQAWCVRGGSGVDPQ